MTRFIVRNLALCAALTLIAGAAPAHTGHGHDDFSGFEGLLHALREPDHQLMLLGGVLVASLLAPRVLALGRRLGEVLRWRKSERRMASQTAQKSLSSIERS